MSSTPARRWSAARTSAVIAISALLLIGAGGFATWSYKQADSAESSYVAMQVSLKRAQADRDTAQADHDARVAAAQAAEQAAAQAAATAKRERDAQAQQDKVYADAGYMNTGNNVYFRWSDKSEFSCGNWDCLGFSVIAVDGCPSSLYLEAAIMSGGTQVGWTNKSFGGLARGGSAAGVFEMVAATGDSFSLTKASCY